MTKTELTENQKQMIADLLIRTKSENDIKEFSERILGNAYGDKKTVKTYQVLAKMRIQRSQSSK